jgi:signal transduction histidine kinase
MESWQTISRIMAHEIMNSLTPLSSLTETGMMLLEEKGRTKDLKDLTQQTIDNLYTALKTISERNLAITQFIGNYRQLSRLPLPNKKKVYISALLAELKELYELPFKEKSIQLDILTGPAKQMIHADDTQVKQVLINLVKNAMEVLEGLPDPRLKISSKRIMDNIVIEVKDNGPGIPADILGKIFVPFFSTKPEGSGIGLSLSRQIIRNHGGQINVESESVLGTTVKVILPVE